MLTQREYQQFKRQHKSTKYLELTDNYASKFQSIKKFKLKNTTKPEKGKKENIKSHQISISQISPNKSSKLHIPAQTELLSALQKSNLLYKWKGSTLTKSIDLADDKKIDSSSIYYLIKDSKIDKCPEMNDLQNKNTLKILKSNIERQKYCQYRWGINQSVNEQAYKKFFKRKCLFNSLEKLSLQKQACKFQSTENQVRIHRKQIILQTKRLPQTIFYQKAKESIKDKIKHKVLNRKRIAESKQTEDQICIDLSDIKSGQCEPHNSATLRRIVSDQTRVGNSKFSRTQKYAEQDANEFLYDTIDSQQQMISQRNENTNEGQYGSKVISKYKKLRQSSKKIQQRQTQMMLEHAKKNPQLSFSQKESEYLYHRRLKTYNF